MNITLLHYVVRGKFDYIVGVYSTPADAENGRERIEAAQAARDDPVLVGGEYYTATLPSFGDFGEYLA